MDKQKTSVGKQLKQANYLKRIEKFDEAIALYHQAIDINPNFALSYYYLSEVLAKVGNLEEAVNQLKIAIKIQPKSAFIRYKYGLLLYQQGYMEKSFEYWFQLSEENIYLPGLINKSIENYRVNYVKQKVCFVHIPKTGGKSINRALYGKDLAWDSLAYHRSIRDHKFKENLYKFCVIRNPFSFYVSLYHFFREYRNKIKNPLRQISDLSFSDFIYILTDYEKLKEYINQNLVNLWHHDLAYIKSENRQIGFFTNYYLYIAVLNHYQEHDIMIYTT
jgi:tetratricopeptide (TPR) repeat protein